MQSCAGSLWTNLGLYFEYRRLTINHKLVTSTTICTTDSVSARAGLTKVKTYDQSHPITIINQPIIQWDGEELLVMVH